MGGYRKAIRWSRTAAAIAVCAALGMSAVGGCSKTLKPAAPRPTSTTNSPTVDYFSYSTTTTAVR
jgi:hypothetical protein